MHDAYNESQFRESVIYAFSHCETWLEDYARTIQAPVHELTNAVADLLRVTGQGSINNMPTLRRKTAKRNKTVRKMALDERTHRKTPRANNKRLSQSIIKSGRQRKRTKVEVTKTRKGVSNYWLKNFPTPEARSAEIMRRRALAAKKAA